VAPRTGRIQQWFRLVVVPAQEVIEKRAKKRQYTLNIQQIFWWEGAEERNGAKRIQGIYMLEECGRDAER